MRGLAGQFARSARAQKTLFVVVGASVGAVAASSSLLSLAAPPAPVLVPPGAPNPAETKAPPPEPAPLVAASSDSHAMTLEPYTGTPFPNLLRGLDLVGVGLRTKYGFFSVYAYGFWADAAKYRTRPEKQALEEMIRGPDHKILRLTFQRDVTGADLKDALEQQLQPRVPAESKAELDTFFAVFKALNLTTGTWLQFDMDNGTVVTEFNGTSLSSLNSPAVAAALLDVYLGSTPISSDFKPFVKKTLKLL